MKAIIQAHNQSILNDKSKQNIPKCNCRKKPECPLNNNCQQREVVYQTTIKNKDETKKYIGSTTDFKARYIGHKSSFRNEKSKNATTLSKYVWNNRIDPEKNMKWEILERSQSYRPGQTFCNLCLTEKLFISKNAHDPSYLNKRTELAQKCRHKAQFKLANLGNPCNTIGNGSTTTTEAQLTHSC